MRSSSTMAFGRYLRTLRERRGLSLDDVANLSRTFADPVEKGYLSRCENGHQSLALSKMIALSRIYEVPAEVLVERLELDLEVEKRFPKVLTDDRPFSELNLVGLHALQRGDLWEAYRLTRTAAHRAVSDPLMSGFRFRTDQELCAVMNLGTVATRLGRYRLANQELSYVHQQNALSDEYRGVLLERLAILHRSIGEIEQAVHFAELAIEHGLSHAEGARYLGGFYGTRALLASLQHDSELALRLHQQAYDANRTNRRTADCAISLLNIGTTYLELGRLRAARRALRATDEAASAESLNRVLALSRITWGELELREGNPLAAREYWTQAIEIAKRTDDRVTLFQAEYHLFEVVKRLGESERAALLEKRLRRRLPWIPEGVEEAIAFRQLQRQQPVRRRSVVTRKRSG